MDPGKIDVNYKMDTASSLFLSFLPLEIRKIVH